MVCQGRLNAQYIQRSAGKYALLQCVGQVGFIDQLTARSIDEKCTWFCCGEQSFVNKTFIFFGKRTVNGNEITLTKQLFQASHLFRVWQFICIIENDLHSKRLSDGCYLVT